MFFHISYLHAIPLHATMVVSQIPLWKERALKRSPIQKL